jgi:hypothetical protein
MCIIAQTLSSDLNSLLCTNLLTLSAGKAYSGGEIIWFATQ